MSGALTSPPDGQAGHRDPEDVVPAPGPDRLDGVGDLAVEPAGLGGGQPVPHDVGVHGVAGGDDPAAPVDGDLQQALVLQGLDGVLVDEVDQQVVAEAAGGGDQLQGPALGRIEAPEPLLDDVDEAGGGGRGPQVPEPVAWARLPEASEPVTSSRR